MSELMAIFKQELVEKNQQLARAEEALFAQQQLTIQANERVRELENGRTKHVSKGRSGKKTKDTSK